MRSSPLCEGVRDDLSEVGLGRWFDWIGGAIVTYGENFPCIVQLYAQNLRDWSCFILR